jgi:hypothetical protein
VSTEENSPTTVADAGMHLLHMFAAVCGAPDDPLVAQQANTALRDLESLLATGLPR